jgi:hypothetical protein
MVKIVTKASFPAISPFAAALKSGVDDIRSRVGVTSSSLYLG